MSIQTIFISAFMVYEITLVIILISPLFGPKNYKKLMQDCTFKIYHTWLYFLSLVGILSIFLFNSIREMQKYSKGSVKFFRAQRNFYISGFNIFLAFLIGRLITMFINHYELQLKAETIIKKTKDTVKLAKTEVSEVEKFLEEHKLKELKELATTEDKGTKVK